MRRVVWEVWQMVKRPAALSLLREPFGGEIRRASDHGLPDTIIELWLPPWREHADFQIRDIAHEVIGQGQSVSLNGGYPSSQHQSVQFDDRQDWPFRMDYKSRHFCDAGSPPPRQAPLSLDIALSALHMPTSSPSFSGSRARPPWTAVGRSANVQRSRGFSSHGFGGHQASAQRRR